MAAQITFSADQKRLVKQLARRRMFVFFFGLIGVSAIVPPYSANQRTLAANFAVLAASAAAIAFIAVRRRRRSLEDLVFENNVVLALVFVIGASLAVHFSFPVFVFTVLLLVNRFL